MNNEECIICGAPLEYLDDPIEMECAICHRKKALIPPLPSAQPAHVPHQRYTLLALR